MIGHSVLAIVSVWLTGLCATCAILAPHPYNAFFVGLGAASFLMFVFNTVMVTLSRT